MCYYIRTIYTQVTAKLKPADRRCSYVLTKYIFYLRYILFVLKFVYLLENQSQGTCEHVNRSTNELLPHSDFNTMHAFSVRNTVPIENIIIYGMHIATPGSGSLYSI